MTCQLCDQPGEYRERFKAVLCDKHNLEALLAFLGDQPKARGYVAVVPMRGPDGASGEREEHGPASVRAGSQLR
jgi:hypothetical protein